MKQHNVGVGDFVAISSNNRFDTYIPILAITYVGSIYSFFHPDLNLSKTNEICRYFNFLNYSNIHDF